LLLTIHPRAPVGPKFQSWVDPSGMLSPRVKSGPAVGNGGSAAGAHVVKNSETVTAATSNHTVLRGKFFIVVTCPFFVEAVVRKRLRIGGISLRRLRSIVNA
jgi:hypothetical protein